MAQNACKKVIASALREAVSADIQDYFEVTRQYGLCVRHIKVLDEMLSQESKF